MSESGGLYTESWTSNEVDRQGNESFEVKEGQMKNPFRVVSCGLFILAGLSFLLPFVRASLLWQSSQLSGIQLVVGAKNSAPEVLAILAFLISLTGIGFAFVNGKIGGILSGLSGTTGFILLLLLQLRLNSEAQGHVDLDILAGFWIAVVILLIAAVFNIYLVVSKKKGVDPDVEGSRAS